MSFDLLDAVLPAEGRFCVFGVGKYPIQSFVDTRKEVTAKAEELVRRGIDAFFGCAKYGPENNRTHENAHFFRALWIDLDCGEAKAAEGKGYPTQEAGLLKLREFCKVLNLPRPIIIDSGYGLHIYWLIEEVLTRQQWNPLAKRLRELCIEHNLIVDPAVFEASRVLRIPGTFNFKRGSKVEVNVINENTERMTYEHIKELLGAASPAEELPDFLPQKLSSMMEALMGNRIKRFNIIMKRSAKGDGCQQLVHCYENQATLEEPLWRAALSITAFCEDGRKSAHRMSDQYPGYEAEEVDKKLDYIIAKGGPYTCATFEKLNPSGCEGCPHKGKIKSPIVLGSDVAEAENNEVILETEEGEQQKYVIPTYPFPYVRGKNGGIYKKPMEEEEELTLVYEYDFYPVKRMKHPELGEVALFRLHLPQDGVNEFVLPITAVVVKEKLREGIAHHGVVTTGKQIELLTHYVAASLKSMQFERKAEIMRTQFGWVDKDSKFILGDREITKDGVFHSPPSTVTKDVAQHVHFRGTLEKWQEVFNMYNLPGLEPHAFAALTGFGSPLLKFTGLEGALINVIHPESGSGKSTTLYMCNSIMGHPKRLGSIWKDTANAKIQVLGVMNNLANTIDEITNTTPAEFSELVYSITQGRGKNRVKSNANELRVNNTSWQGISLASANASFYEKLGALKTAPDGEMMRLLEYHISPNAIIDPARGKELFDHQLFDNYGHAGEVYLQWLVNNLEEAKDLLMKVQARLDKQLQVTQKERFWSATAACNITGGLIAKNLGLIDFDMKRIYDWLVGMLASMRKDVDIPDATPQSILGAFINAHMNHALVVNGATDSKTGLTSLPLAEPKGELVVRYEPDNKWLYVPAAVFKKYCVERQVNYKDTLRSLTADGVYLEPVNKRMSTGMKISSPPVRALKFNAKDFGLDSIVPQNAS
jgi:hypothetical protein